MLGTNRRDTCTQCTDKELLKEKRSSIHAYALLSAGQFVILQVCLLLHGGCACHTWRPFTNKLSHIQTRTISFVLGLLMDCISPNMDVTNSLFMY